ncbi:MAG: HypC/HybG/HupF family hydrogenase formation chaperone [Sutterellaceae bacterium]|nr:HypC/HybG/HupF family hydrogenase formation chaperone [Sutterellaceae bacterium]MDD7443075.1 HypC/HybG/HupF family hydrogenase formation chaperone [Sutterellaceae bacterium]MDY2869019.1 HypC/HybG/HupF family hydrogenase formation chaperone [Mesosutterella sp.]
MCIAIPKKVVRVKSELEAVCDSSGKEEDVNTELTGRVSVGDWLLVFRGAAQRVMGEEEALKMRTALTALSDVMAGTATESEVDSAFSDITAHSGELPEFLRSQVGRKPAGL